MTVSCKVTLFTPHTPTPAQLVEATRNADARKLPNDLFASHPDVVRLTNEAARWSVRRELLRTIGPSKHVRASAAVAEIAAELEEAKNAFRLAALDEYLDGGHEATALADKRVADLECRLRAARSAEKDMRHESSREMNELCLQAQNHLACLLLDLKRKALP